MLGHLFIVRGDLTHLACDAVLIPSGYADGATGHIRPAWRPVLGDAVDARGFVRNPPTESARVVPAAPGVGIEKPAIWVGHTGDDDREPEWYGDAIAAFLHAAAGALADDDVAAAARR